MRRLIQLVILVGIAGLAAFWYITAPHPREMTAFAGRTGDPAHGEQVFWATGCASCHMAPGAKDDAQRVLSGGQTFVTAFGTFLAPNISPDPDQGIGEWSLEEFIHAVQDGVTPDGQHEYPAMPYVAYARLVPQDVVDLKAFIDTLPPSATPSLPHQLSFPFNIRRSLGAWKFLFGSDAWVLTGDLTPEVERGRYIAEAMAHCGECHTPRNALGGSIRSRWLGGAPVPDGKGRVPNITPAKLDWTEEDIVTYLTTGQTPDFDFVGGSMTHVVDNMARLPASDVKAVAAYLKAVPAVP